MRTKVRIILLATAAILMVMLFIGMSRQTEAAVAVKGSAAFEKDIYNSVYAPGQVEAAESRDITVAHAATVVHIYAQTGETVKAGDPLVGLRKSSVSISEEAVQTFAQQFLEGELADEHAIVTAMQDAGVQAEEEYVVYAEMDGVVLKAPESTGENLMPGVTYMRIADLSKLRVRAEIPELYVGQLRDGQHANITGDILRGQTLSAKVKTIAPYARRAVSFTGQSSAATVETVLSITGSPEGLRPGNTVEVRIFTDSVKDAVLVPYDAVVQREGREYVFRVQNGIACLIPVEIGYELDGYVQVVSGIGAGDIVIHAPEDTLQDGDPVEVTGL